MPRKKMQRIVHRPPLYTDFKPIGVRRLSLDTIELSIDEYEAIRLADNIGMNHNDAADEMEISRSTFSRLIENARKKIAEFIIEGKHLQIDGGNIHFRGNIIKCNSCGHMFNTNFENKINKCPSCGSDNLIDLAGGFGHGRCCSNNSKGKRQGSGQEQGQGRNR